MPNGPLWLQIAHVVVACVVLGGAVAVAVVMFRACALGTRTLESVARFLVLSFVCLVTLSHTQLLYQVESKAIAIRRSQPAAPEREEYQYLGPVPVKYTATYEMGQGTHIYSTAITAQDVVTPMVGWLMWVALGCVLGLGYRGWRRIFPAKRVTPSDQASDTAPLPTRDRS